MRISARCRCIVVALVVYATECLAQIPLPEDINIVPPSVGLRKDVAAFSGKWSGVWSGKLQSLLIIEEIDGERAKVVYAWGDAPDWKIVKGFRRYPATVASGDKKEIQFNSDVAVFTVRMNDDLSSITVTRVRSTPGQRDIETFKRVAADSVPARSPTAVTISPAENKATRDSGSFPDCVRRAVTATSRSGVIVIYSREEGEKWCAENGYIVDAPADILARFPIKDAKKSNKDCIERGVRLGYNVAFAADWCWKNEYRN